MFHPNIIMHFYYLQAWLALTTGYKLTLEWNDLHNSGEKRHSHYCTMGFEIWKGHNLDLVCALKIACR